MGGFQLIGPNFIIKNTKDLGYECKCMPFMARINEATEILLVSKETKTLVVRELPIDLQLAFKEAKAWNEGMNYYIEDNKNKHVYDTMIIDRLDYVFSKSLLD